MAEAQKDRTCEERAQSHLDSRLETLQEIWEQTVTGDRIPCDECEGEGTILREVDVATRADPAFSGCGSYRDKCEECDGAGYVSGEPAEYTEDGENLYEHGLSFDYVAPETFNDQPEGFWRYQLGCGGPQDEFRFFVSPGGSTPYRIEYWFLDWFDGASRNVTQVQLIQDIWQWFEPAWYEFDYSDADK